MCWCLAAGRSKYLVQHVVRTNRAADDTSFHCVMQLQDEEGVMGVRLNKDIVQVGFMGVHGCCMGVHGYAWVFMGSC